MKRARLNPVAVITIRKARPLDLPLLQEFEKEFDRDQRNIVSRQSPKLKVYLKRPPGRGKAFTKWARGWIRSKNALVLIAERDLRPVGFAASWIQTQPPAFLPKRFGFVGYLFVRAACRGEGISSMLMEETLRWFAKRKIEHVSLTVLEYDQPARAIYRRWGFADFLVAGWKPLERTGSSLRSG